eukprot:6723492-Pyramimonas_sp.AAC.1
MITQRENQSQEGRQYIPSVRTNRRRGGSISPAREPIAGGEAVYTKRVNQSQEGRQYIPGAGPVPGVVARLALAIRQGASARGVGGCRLRRARLADGAALLVLVAAEPRTGDFNKIYYYNY